MCMDVFCTYLCTFYLCTDILSSTNLAMCVQKSCRYILPYVYRCHVYISCHMCTDVTSTYLAICVQMSRLHILPYVYRCHVYIYCHMCTDVTSTYLAICVQMSRLHILPYVYRCHVYISCHAAVHRPYFTSILRIRLHLYLLTPASHERVRLSCQRVWIHRCWCDSDLRWTRLDSTERLVTETTSY